MGTDKASLPFGDSTLLQRVVQRLRACCDPVLVVTRPPHRYAVSGARVAVDRWPGLGPLAGLEAGLRAAPTVYAAVVACDLPFLRPELVRGLAREAQGWDAAVPTTDRPHPLCAVYHRRAAEGAELLLRSGGGSLRDLLARLRVRYVPEEVLRGWDPDLASFLNVNTPEDYARALALLAAEGGATELPGGPPP